MRTTSLILSSVTATALAVTAGALAYANSAPPSAPDAPPGIAPVVFDAMQRDLHITPLQARNRLNNESRAAAVQQVLRRTLGAAYAGTWLSGDAEASTITVALTDPAGVSSVRALGAVPRLVGRGEAQLDRVVAALDRTTAPSAVKGWYADIATNQVVVLSATGADEGFLARASVDRAAVRVERTTENPRPYIDVIGGNAYFIGSGTRCSVGFSVSGGFARPATAAPPAPARASLRARSAARASRATTTRGSRSTPATPLAAWSTTTAAARSRSPARPRPPSARRSAAPARLRAGAAARSSRRTPR
ncbi:MAG TPA: S1 family peptidase [Dactylosporangium sp.]|nr:S1 family peptidase [Dactylosporangium sp.]